MSSIIKYSALLLILSLIDRTSLFSQEIDFGTYSSQYSVTLSELLPAEDLDFGLLIQNGGNIFGDEMDAKVLSIEGVKYLDVIVTVTADQYLLLVGGSGCETDPTCRAEFFLKVKYANRGLNDIGEAIDVTVTSNFGLAQFPIRYRGDAPPGPPPTPVYEGYNPSLYNDTAYLYIYGDLNIGDVQAGSYEAEITISVNYD